MVIIKKATRYTSRQSKSKKPFIGALAVLLAVLVTVSAFIFAMPLASAKGESPFVDCEEIFIDMTGFTGWASSGAEFRVFTFYNDSDSLNYCREFPGNFENDGWYEGDNVLRAGIQAVKFADNVYSFRIPANNLSHLRIVRTGHEDGQLKRWNMTPYMWDNQRSKYSAGGKYYSKQNAIRITDWNSASWSTYTPTLSNSTTYSEVTANPDSSITSKSNLYTIDATFYDYYTDDEIQNGWGNIRYSTNHANGTTGAYWEPYQYLNSKIAAQGGRYPLYFGNFYDKKDGYQGEGSSNMTNFSNWVNNSSGLGGPNKSVVGLTGPNLVNGDLYYAADGGGNSSTKVPIFDKSWLQANRVGSVVNTKFPMRKETTNGVTTYAFNSEGSTSKSAGDSVWFNSSHNTISYGTGSASGAKDALYYYSAPQESSGYGFFPFDSTRNTEANNFGFGMRVDVKFNLGADDSNHIGQIKGTNGSYVDQVFNFTGDDDVWVYVDGNLILDLGGDHKKANGSINFHNRSVSVTTGTNTLNGATRNTSFTLDGYGDPTAEHTLTMFYVERGMVESNLSFNFNFAPVGNELIVDKTVNTANTNSGFTVNGVNAVAQADTFSFNQPTANGKVSSKGTISNSTYTLKNKESISFKDQFAVPTDMTVTESESSPLEYTTSWKAVDLVLKGKGHPESEYTIASSSGNSKTANFTYKTLDTSSEFAMTRVQLSYVNTPVVNSFTLTKNVTGNSSDATEFGATVLVKLPQSSDFQPYPLQYTASDKSGQTFTLTSSGKLWTGSALKAGRTLTFAKIPVGAQIKIVEDDNEFYDYHQITVNNGASVTPATNGNGGSFTLGSNGNAVTVTNTPPTAVTITKTVSSDTNNEDTTEFGASVLVKYKNETNFMAHALEYYIEGDGTARYTLGAGGALQSGAALRSGRTLVFDKVPKGSQFKVVENSAAGYNFTAMVAYDDDDMPIDVTSVDNGGSIAVGTNGNHIEITNTPMDGSGTLRVRKFLDNQVYKGGTMFTFVMKGMRGPDSSYVDVTSTTVTQNTVDANGWVNFNVSFSQTGKYRYQITEQPKSDLAAQGWFTDTNTYYVEFEVVTGSTGLEMRNKQFYINDFTEDNKLDDSEVWFDNYSPAKIIINKADGNGNPVNETNFAVVKVDRDYTNNLPEDYVERLNEIIDDYDGTTTDTMLGETTTNGKLEFANLPIWQNGDLMFSFDSSDNWVYGSTYGTSIIEQTYMVFEYSPKNGFNSNKTVHFVTFPYGQDGLHEVTYDYVNAPVMMPDSSGRGMRAFLTLGAGILGTAALMAMAYTLYNKRCRVRRRVRKSARGRHFK